MSPKMSLSKSAGVPLKGTNRLGANVLHHAGLERAFDEQIYTLAQEIRDLVLQVDDIE
jgi:hypothetical protein